MYTNCRLSSYHRDPNHECDRSECFEISNKRNGYECLYEGETYNYMDERMYVWLRNAVEVNPPKHSYSRKRPKRDNITVHCRISIVNGNGEKFFPQGKKWITR